MANANLLERLLDSKGISFCWQECSDSVYLMHWVVGLSLTLDGTAWSVS